MHNSFDFVFLCFTGERYYLLETGQRRCPKGYEVMDTTECEEACDQLQIPLSGKKFKPKKPCYKGGSGVCNQNGAFNRRASLICKQEDNEDGGGGMLRVISLPSDQKFFYLKVFLQKGHSYHISFLPLDGSDGNADGMYFLEKRCSKETKITNTDECKKACESMGFPLSNRPFKEKKPCYKGGTGVCNQNGALGKQSEMICKSNGNPIKFTYCISRKISHN